MLKMYKAQVKDENGKQIILVREYHSKKAFAEDICNNGFKCCFISTPENFERDWEKYYERLQNMKIRYQVHKKMKEEYGFDY